MQKNVKKPSGIFFVDSTTTKWSQQGFIFSFSSRNLLIRWILTVFCFTIRYHELLEIHGHVAPFAKVKLAPPKVANVWVRFGEQRWNEKSISLYMTMKELRGISLEKIMLFAYFILVELFQKSLASRSVFPRQNSVCGILIFIRCLCAFLQKDCTVTTWKTAMRFWSMRNCDEFFYFILVVNVNWLWIKLLSVFFSNY